MDEQYPQAGDGIGRAEGNDVLEERFARAERVLDLVQGSRPRHALKAGPSLAVHGLELVHRL